MRAKHRRRGIAHMQWESSVRRHIERGQPLSRSWLLADEENAKHNALKCPWCRNR